MPRDFHASFMKPLAALATPGVYLFGKYNQYKRQQQEQSRRKVTEKELAQLNHKIDKLLAKLDEHEPEMATTQDDECVVCISAKASMQTYPCGHQVVCRKCFVKTIQMAVSQRLLPLRCVICRTKILRLKQQSTGSGSSATSSRSFILSHSHSHSSQLTSYSSTSSYHSATSGSTSMSMSTSTSGSSVFQHQRHHQHHHHHHHHRTDSSQRPLLVDDGSCCCTGATPKSNHRIRLIVTQHDQDHVTISPPSPSPSPSPPPDGAATTVVESSSPRKSSVAVVVDTSSLPAPAKLLSKNNKVQDSSMMAEIMCFNKPAKEKVTNRKFNKLPSLPKVALRSRCSLAKSKKE